MAPPINLRKVPSAFYTYNPIEYFSNSYFQLSEVKIALFQDGNCSNKSVYNQKLTLVVSKQKCTKKIVK